MSTKEREWNHFVVEMAAYHWPADWMNMTLNQMSQNIENDLTPKHVFMFFKYRYEKPTQQGDGDRG